jgi:CheY-like chemotaxis protein
MISSEYSSETVHFGTDHTVCADGGPSLPLKKGSTISVLVIEDNRLMRNALRDALQQCGFEVWIAQDGLEGLSLYRRLIDRIDVVLSDVNMPRLDGPGAVSAIRLLNPAARCCFMTCDTRQSTVDALLAYGVLAIYKKPFPSIAELAGLLRDIATMPPLISGSHIDANDFEACGFIDRPEDSNYSGGDDWCISGMGDDPTLLEEKNESTRRSSPIETVNESSSRAISVTSSARLCLSAGLAFLALGGGAVLARCSSPVETRLVGLLPVGAFYLLLAIGDVIATPRIQGHSANNGPSVRRISQIHPSGHDASSNVVDVTVV